MYRNQVEGWTVASGERGTPSQGKSLVSASAKQFRRHGKEELVNEVERDQRVVETGSTFDHERLDATFSSDGPHGFLQVDRARCINRCPHHLRELAQPFYPPLGYSIG